MTNRAETLNPDSAITGLLNQWMQGKEEATEELLPMLYPRLQRIAKGLFRQERANHTLQPTALVHEGFLRLKVGSAMQWHGREHFFSTVARLMRQILIDHARSSLSKKRGGDQEKHQLTAALDLSDIKGGELLALDEALFSLRKVDRKKAEIVELQFFGGLSFEEIAKIQGRSRSTVFREWKVARLWLLDELSRGTS